MHKYSFVKQYIKIKYENKRVHEYNKEYMKFNKWITVIIDNMIIFRRSGICSFIIIMYILPVLWDGSCCKWKRNCIGIHRANNVYCDNFMQTQPVQTFMNSHKINQPPSAREVDRLHIMNSHLALRTHINLRIIFSTILSEWGKFTRLVFFKKFHIIIATRLLRSHVEYWVEKKMNWFFEIEFIHKENSNVSPENRRATFKFCGTATIHVQSYRVLLAFGYIGEEKMPP